MIRHFKYAKSEVEYTPRAMNDNEQCRLCRHYHEHYSDGVVGRCDIVEGEIKPGAWCNKFEVRKESEK